MKYELDSYAESINGYYDVLADGRNGDLIAIQFYGMNPETIEDEELTIDSGYITDFYIELRCSLRESAISIIGSAFSKN